jgi:hypothetical protein
MRKIIGQSCKNLPHAFAGDFLQSFRHNFHAEQKQAKAADQAENGGLIKEIQHGLDSPLMERKWYKIT